MYITIDMQTGERVFLNDLIIVDEDFVNLFWQGGIIQIHENMTFHLGYDVEQFNKSVAGISYEKISRKLYEASYPPIKLGFNDTMEDRQRIFFGASFHLEHNRLVIIDRWSDPDTPFVLSLDDISEFLKVPRW
ncbi:MAG: hypothetical protein FWE02_00805 [Defluviitaleaceae bacterium]|nr:hypothetical protein [Defluviitaleaceae bacterium]